MIDTIACWIHAAITVALVIDLVCNEIRLEEMQARMDEWLEQEPNSRRRNDST